MLDIHPEIGNTDRQLDRCNTTTYMYMYAQATSADKITDATVAHESMRHCRARAIAAHVTSVNS